MMKTRVSAAAGTVPMLQTRAAAARRMRIVPPALCEVRDDRQRGANSLMSRQPVTRLGGSYRQFRPISANFARALDCAGDDAHCAPHERPSYDLRHLPGDYRLASAGCGRLFSPEMNDAPASGAGRWALAPFRRDDDGTQALRYADPRKA